MRITGLRAERELVDRIVMPAGRIEAGSLLEVDGGGSVRHGGPSGLVALDGLCKGNGMSSPSPEILRVVAAVLVDRSGRVLIAQRPPGKWQAGRWEFPGGKIELGEDEAQAVVRELAEELGVRVDASQRLAVFRHDYLDRSVEIGLWLVLRHEGEVRGLDGQALRWVTVAELDHCDLLEADLPMLPVLRRALGSGEQG